MAVGSVNGLNNINFLSVPTLDPSQDTGSSPVNFSDYLNTALDQVNNLQIDAENSANDLAIGNTDDIAGVMVAEQKADTALQLTMQIRNKILDAYNEIMRIQI